MNLLKDYKRYHYSRYLDSIRFHWVHRYCLGCYQVMIVPQNEGIWRSARRVEPWFQQNGSDSLQKYQSKIKHGTETSNKIIIVTSVGDQVRGTLQGGCSRVDLFLYRAANLYYQLPVSLSDRVWSLPPLNLTASTLAYCSLNLSMLPQRKSALIVSSEDLASSRFCLLGNSPPSEESFMKQSSLYLDSDVSSSGVIIGVSVSLHFDPCDEKRWSQAVIAHSYTTCAELFPDESFRESPWLLCSYVSNDLTFTEKFNHSLSQIFFEYQCTFIYAPSRPGNL